MANEQEDWNVPESELPSRRVTGTAVQELVTAGYEHTGQLACPSCGRKVNLLSSPAATRPVTCNPDGTLHANCREAREPEPEPLPPVATYEEQQRKLDRLLGKSDPESLR